jgi:rRNA-processing protein FCF1
MDENIVIIDANFILLPFQFKIHYLDEIELKLEGKVKFIIFKQVIDELKAKEMRKKSVGKFSQYFNSGLLYIEKNEDNYSIVHDPQIKRYDETSDDFLIRKCSLLKKKGKKVYLATNDHELKLKAKKQKINLIFIRQKKIISIERA